MLPVGMFFEPIARISYGWHLILPLPRFRQAGYCTEWEQLIYSIGDLLNGFESHTFLCISVLAWFSEALAQGRFSFAHGFAAVQLDLGCNLPCHVCLAGVANLLLKSRVAITGGVDIALDWSI